MAMAANYNAKAQQRQQVTQEEATCIAIRLLTNLNGHTERITTNLQMTEKRDSIGNVVLYEVTADSISVLLSGSRACYPLLGKYHTPNGPLLNDYDNLPDNLRWLIDGYIAQIVPCFSNDTIRLYYNDEWNNLIEGTNLSNREEGENVVLEFTSKWSQQGCNINNDNNPIIGYEYYMPPDANNSCNHSVVGCGAVAVGQVLNYWKHPVSPDWNVTYDRCNMSDILDVNSPDFQKNREAIALLLKDCAVPITESYGCVRTSSDFSRIPSALINYFNYSPNAHLEWRIDHPNDWNALLKNQINQKRPILYAGGGHTFVCYGYYDNHQGDFFIMLNMGNGYTGNGWYTPNDISFDVDQDHYDFTSNQRAIFDVYPDNWIDICHRDVALDEYYSAYQDEIASGTWFPWKMLPVTVTNLTSASGGSPESWRTIPMGEESIYKAQESIVLEDGFVVERGADFAAIISPCDNCGHSLLTETQNAYLNPCSSGDIESMGDPFLQKEESAPFSENEVVKEMEPKEALTLMPNPASSHVTVMVHLVEEDAHNNILTLLDGTGNEHFRRVINQGETRLTLSLEGLPSGLYFVTLTTAKGTSTQKLVVEGK